MAVVKQFAQPNPTALGKSSTDAPTHNTNGWHDIDWYDVTRNVRRQQVRIVKATNAGKWRRITSLQHLLTHSFSGKAMAVKRVTEKQPY